MDPIQAYLDALKQGGKQSNQKLTMIPLLETTGGEPGYLWSLTWKIAKPGLIF
jgi:hypothetical protein